MGFVAAGPFMIPLAEEDLWIYSSIQTSLLDATGERTAVIFQAPKTGTIKGFGFRLGAVTTGKTLKISHENVVSGICDDVSDESFTVAVADTDDNTWKEGEWATGRSVTKGEPVAVVIEWNNDADPGNLEICYWGSAPGAARNLGMFSKVRHCHRTGGNWGAASNGFPIAAIKYSDGTYPLAYGVWPIKDAATFNFPSGGSSSPDEIGFKFQVPFACKVGGVWWVGPSSGGNPGNIRLYDGASNVLGGGDAYPEGNTGSGAASVQHLRFADVVLDKDTDYRLAWESTSTFAHQLPPYEITVNASAMREMFEMGLKMVKTSRTNGGAWTDDPTNTTIIGGMGLIITALADGQLPLVPLGIFAPWLLIKAWF